MAVYYLRQKKTGSSTLLISKPSAAFTITIWIFALQAHYGGKKNYIIYDILIEHFSVGKMDANLLAGVYSYFQKKWKPDLPVFIGSLSKKQISDFEGYALTKAYC